MIQQRIILRDGVPGDPFKAYHLRTGEILEAHLKLDLKYFTFPIAYGMKAGSWHFCCA